MKKLSFIIVMLVISVSIFGCHESGAMSSGTKAADFTLGTLDGQTVTLSSLKGKKVLLDFFATWCPPCRQELKEIDQIVNEYQSDDYAILCISVDRSKKTVESFMRKQGYSMTVLFDDQNVAQQYGVRGIPALYLVDKNGDIAWT
ncbi:MAG: TlpA family protein disulfide reductase, partial [Candidatus Omnitrophica bacterium]|nr:TlpA family protein disulfide reductase [Candidatus Omnitrophota bacterium]